MPLFSKIAGRYSVDRRLYHRGAAVAFLARDERSHDEVVIEVTSPERDSGWSQALERRRTVAAILSGLEHPNLADVRELILDEPHLCLVKAWEPGVLLDEWLRSSAAADSWPLAISLCRDILEGLAALHNAGLLHRDLRPRNIWLRTGDGRPMAQLDHFDDAVPEGADEPGLVGSAARRAPEVARGHPYSRRSDVYAAGLLLFEILTSPADEPLEEILVGGLLDEKALAKVPAPYGDVVRRACRSFSVERFDDALDLLAAFDVLDLKRRLQQAGFDD